MKMTVCCVLVALVAFAVGSTKGDDLLEYVSDWGKKPLGEMQEVAGRPFNHEEIKEIAVRVMQEKGHDLSDKQRVHGMTTDHGFIITALGSNDKFIAQVFINKDFNLAQCSSKL